MIQLILFIAVGALLLFLVFFLARRAPHSEAGAKALFDARRALSRLQVELLPSELVARIFAKDDLEYVTSLASASIRDMFLAERKRIVLSWVRHLRQQITKLRQFHLGSARLYARLSFRMEVALAIDFAILLFACLMLELTIRIRGPYGALRIVGATTAAAARVCETSEKALGFLRPGNVSPFGNPPAGNRATL